MPEYPLESSGDTASPPPESFTRRDGRAGHCGFEVLVCVCVLMLMLMLTWVGSSGGFSLTQSEVFFFDTGVPLGVIGLQKRAVEPGFIGTVPPLAVW